MTKKKAAPKTDNEATPSVDPQEYLVLGHLIKYNLYMLAKSVVFAAVSKNVDDTDKAVDVTNRVMQELDLDSKRRTQATDTQESVQQYNLFYYLRVNV